MTLKEVCQANPKGFTFDLETGLVAKHESGYYVSLTNYCDSKPNFDNIVKAYSFFSNVCGRKCYIRGWKDHRTIDGDKYYIDITVRCGNHESAVHLGKIFNKKAIFNCKTKESIYI
jgi:hypothetical protein